jgi:hypothetical protein
VGSWGRAFIPGEIRTAGFALPLLTRGAGQAGEVWLLGKNFSHGSVVRELSKKTSGFLVDGFVRSKALAKIKEAECKV